MVLLAVVGVVAFKFGPLSELASAESLEERLSGVGTDPVALLVVAAVFITLTSLGFPMLVLVTATGAALPPWVSLSLCVTCMMCAAWIGFVLGRRLPLSVSERRLEGNLARLQSLVSRGNTLGMMVLRNIPVAPFAWVNMGCGALGYPARPYFIGTLIGTMPPLLLFGLFGRELRVWLEDPSLESLLPLVLAGLGVGALVVLTWFLKRRQAGRGASPRTPG